MTLIDLTLSNARRFYSSMGNPLDMKGLRMRAYCCTSLGLLLAWLVSQVSDTCRQAVGSEISAPRTFETYPFHPLGSICNLKQLPYICKNLPVPSSMRDAQV